MIFEKDEKKFREVIKKATNKQLMLLMDIFVDELKSRIVPSETKL